MKCPIIGNYIPQHPKTILPLIKEVKKIPAKDSYKLIVNDTHIKIEYLNNWYKCYWVFDRFESPQLICEDTSVERVRKRISNFINLMQ